MNWEINIKSFSELTVEELYAILALRQEVFVVEQTCPYLDADGKDQKCLHLFAKNTDGEIGAYLRLVPKGVSYEKYSSIGRVVNSKRFRGHGLGKKIMQSALDHLRAHWANDTIKISAQCYLLGFYEKLGFEKIGEEYLEDDIPHQAMLLSFESN